VAQKSNTQEPEAPVQGAFFMLADDFLNTVEREMGQIESLSAFAKLQKVKGIVKQTEEAWREALHDFMNAVPS
jgi:hypothetical protein